MCCDRHLEIRWVSNIEKVSRDRNIEKWLQTTPEDWNKKSIKIEKASRDRNIEKWLQTTPEDWNPHFRF